MSQQRPASRKLAGRFYVCTAGAPAVGFSVLASSVIIVAARAGLLSTCVVPTLGLCFYIPELLSDALFFRRCLLGLRLSVDLPFPCGQVTVVLLHKGRSSVIRPFERLHVGIAVLLEYRAAGPSGGRFPVVLLQSFPVEPYALYP